MVDISRQTTGVNLPEELSAEIWGDTVENSAIMQRARRINLPGAGVTVHSITGEPVAQWVSETEAKPVDRHTLESKSITPYKLAVIEPFSDEFRRDLPRLYSELARRLPFALAKAFYETVYGTVTAPGANFDQLSSTSTTQTVDGTDTVQDLAAAYTAVTAENGDIDTWIASPALVGLLITAQSQVENFNLGSGLQVGSVFGAPVLKTRATLPAGPPAILGYAGDFASDAVYGTVEGVQVSISDQATLTDGSNTINLWQQNMFAVRAEIEVGFRVTNVDRFVQLNDGTSS